MQVGSPTGTFQWHTYSLCLIMAVSVGERRGGIHLSFGLVFYLLHDVPFVFLVQVITAHLNA